MVNNNLLPAGSVEEHFDYNEKISRLDEEDFFKLFKKLNVDPRWVTSAGKRAIQIIGACHHGDNHSALFDPDTLIVNCFSECGRGMLLHTWIKQSLNLDNPHEAKEFIEDWIENQNIDLSNKIPHAEKGFEFKERPYECTHIDPVEGIDIVQVTDENLFLGDLSFDKSMKILRRLVWCTEEKIDAEILNLYDVCYNWDTGGIILPHHNINGEIVGIYERSFMPIRRQVKIETPDIEYKDLMKYPRAKYLPLLRADEYQTEEKTSWSFPNGKNLYGLHLAKEAIKETGKAIVFEGAKSVMLARQYGYPYAVATHTYGAHTNHISMLIECGAKEIILAFDKQYERMEGLDWDLYEKKTQTLADKVKTHVKVSRIIDNAELLDYKSAPIDHGKDVFEKLCAARENLSAANNEAEENAKSQFSVAQELAKDDFKSRLKAEQEERRRKAKEEAEAYPDKYNEIWEFIAEEDNFWEAYNNGKAIDIPAPHEANAANGEFQFGDLLIQRQKDSLRFLLPNEGNKSVTAYEIIGRLAGDNFKSYRKQIKFKNNKIQILPYSERRKLVFYFRRQYRSPPILENAEIIVAFIHTAIKYTNNIELKQTWYACLDATGKHQEAAASLFVHYGWAAIYNNEFPREENVFYTVDEQNGARHYEIVEDNMRFRFSAIEDKSHTCEAYKIIANRSLTHDEKKKDLENMLYPIFWWHDGIKMGLTAEARDICNARINKYIDDLLAIPNLDDINIQTHIQSVEIDKSETGFVWAKPRTFVISMDDMEFVDHQYNITAEYNKENAAALGAARSRKSAERNFSEIVGDEWTTQELYAQGVDKDKISRLVKQGLIERPKRGYYRRI